jgi:hypothetical protein
MEDGGVDERGSKGTASGPKEKDGMGDESESTWIRGSRDP